MTTTHALQAATQPGNTRRFKRSAQWWLIWDEVLVLHMGVGCVSLVSELYKSQNIASRCPSRDSMLQSPAVTPYRTQNTKKIIIYRPRQTAGYPKNTSPTLDSPPWPPGRHPYTAVGLAGTVWRASARSSGTAARASSCLLRRILLPIGTRR